MGCYEWWSLRRKKTNRKTVAIGVKVAVNFGVAEALTLTLQTQGSADCRTIFDAFCGGSGDEVYVIVLDRPKVTERTCRTRSKT